MHLRRRAVFTLTQLFIIALIPNKTGRQSLIQLYFCGDYLETKKKTLTKLAYF